MAWSWADVQHSEAGEAPVRGPKIRVAVTLDAADLAHIDVMAEAGGCSRAETARRLLAGVIEDDRAAHSGQGEAADGRAR